MIVGRTALNFALSNRDQQVAQLLLSKGADPNIRDNEGRTMLNQTMHGSRWELVHILIDGGADVNAKDKAGATPSLWPISWQWAVRWTPRMAMDVRRFWRL
jgi:ankyrin repeat protein